ncbi:unnamed protein product [Adineta ricciae]|nr:unnamed protein product [Adineta ricciae]
MKDYFERLEIKNIQYYSLGYLLTDHYLRIHTNYRHVRSSCNYLTNLLLVYNDDSWSQIMFCYKYGNFLRINEIRIFSDCYLSYSLIYFQALIGALVVDFIQNGNRYRSISTLLKHPSNQVLFEHKQKNKQSLHGLFYKTNTNEVYRVQDTRDYDIWPKIDHRRLRFNSIEKEETPNETVAYADRILNEHSDQSSYQSPSYKDSFLRQYQTVDFQQRVALCYLRANILNLLHTLYVDRKSSADAIHMPDEEVFQTLKLILADYSQCTKALNPTETITPCELQTIVDLELYQAIPLFIQLLLDGITLNKTAEAAPTLTKISLSNVKIAYDKIEQHINDIIKQLERSYQLLVQALQKTLFQKRCTATNDETADFLNDLAGKQSPIEYYSVYTEFTSYTYGLYLSIRLIFAALFNKTALLVEGSESADNRTLNSKKSKKKGGDQQSETVENPDEIKLWSQLEKIEVLYNDQWTQVIENIQKYETYLRKHGQLNANDYERLEKQLDVNSDQSTNKSKSKADENTSSSGSSTKDNQEDPQTSNLTLQLSQLAMRSSTRRAFTLGYLESFIQIRVCLTTKQKTLRLRLSST